MHQGSELQEENVTLEFEMGIRWYKPWNTECCSKPLGSEMQQGVIICHLPTIEKGKIILLLYQF